MLYSPPDDPVYSYCLNPFESLLLYCSIVTLGRLFVVVGNMFYN